MNPYASLARGQYSSDDVMAELKISAQADQGYAASLGHYAGANFNPKDAYPAYPAAYSLGSWEGAESKRQLQAAYGNYEPQGKAVSPPGFQKAHWGSEDEFLAYFKKMQQQEYKGTDSGPNSADIYEGAVDVQYREGQVVAERMLDMQQEVFTAVKPIYTYEKIVEIPQVIIKETAVEVPKPEIIERILEVPKTEIHERTIVGPPQVQYQEQIIEVPRVVVEERVIHVPRREIQERLIEVPKVQYVYRDEYEDVIEYREVPVDKIVEVPEIEYRVRHVEKFVDQTYIQEYYTDKYKEIPVTQVQEVERVEMIPMTKEQMAMMGGPPSPPVPPKGVIPYTMVQ